MLTDRRTEVPAFEPLEPRLLLSTAPAYAIVDTGQTKSFNNTDEMSAPSEGDAFYGQDANFDGNAPSYTLSADGLTVLDNVTGLTWTQSADWDGDGNIDADDKFTFTDFLDYADTLNTQNYGGYGDWRAPTIKELYSLMDFSGRDVSSYTGTDTSGLVPFIDTDYFDFGYGDTSAGERIIDAQVWSSTEYLGTTMGGNATTFGLNLADGRIKGYPQVNKDEYAYFVRGNTGYGVNDFADNGDGTITDNATALMWSQDDSGAGMDWEAALAWVQQKNDENYLGHSDWRLPDAKELQSIVDYGRSPQQTGSAAIDPAFNITSITAENGAADWPFFWSGTTHETNSTVNSGMWGAYVCFGEALGYWGGSWQDVHGAGAQRSDPKYDDGTDYSSGHGPQGDAVRIDNFVRLIRDAETTAPTEPTEVVLDNESSGVTVSGSWSTSSWNDTRYGANYLHDANAGKGSNSVTYTPTLVAGTYDVSVWHPHRYTHATNVPVDVTHTGGTDTVTVDQTAPGGTWLLLGTYDFDAGASGNVTIRTDATDGYVMADAVKFTPGTGEPAEPVEVIVDNADATVAGSWSTSSWNDTLYGSDYLHDQNGGKGAKTVTYTPTLNAGTYDVSMWHPYRFTHATNVPVDITHSAATETVTVDQTAPGGTWLLLGTYDFDAGTSGNVVIRTDATDGYVMADAVRFTPSTDGPAEVIVDNGDAAVTVTGGWTTSSWNDTRYGANYLHDDNTDKGAKSVTYAPELAAGTYDVYVWHPYRSTHATNVPVDITYAGGLVDTVTVDQTQPGGTWLLLGTYAFDAGSAGTVTIRTDGTDGYVIADAVKFTPI